MDLLFCNKLFRKGITVIVIGVIVIGVAYAGYEAILDTVKKRNA